MRFARWGLTELFLYGGGFVLVGVGFLFLPGPWALLAILPFVTSGFVAWFFRDPDRTLPGETGVFVSPADGTVADIETIDDPEWIGGKALRVGIFLSPLNVHVNRAPATGTVGWRKYQEGKFLKAFEEECILQNEACAMGMECDTPGDAPPLRIVVRQVVGAVARRIVCPVDEGLRLEAGERYGMIKFGSRTELWVPADAGFECRVKVGDVVRGGETVLGDCRALSPDDAGQEG
ncbi:MAG: phosphatidylserine decarboxylase [Planctomycetota bacterium]|jgi:phosphatidylserine decarboxylase